MNGDPHIQRFFSYLSLFTFFMIILVTGENFLIVFVGWEGSLKCLKWYNEDNSIYSIMVIKILINKKNFFSSINGKKIVSNKRIGPHNIDIISMIIGSVLGDTHLEKRMNGIGTRIMLARASQNVEYLMWFHNRLAICGYCNENYPKLHKRIKKDGIFFHYRINSYTFSSLNWIHDMFYKMDNEKNKLVKIIPLNLENYLTPMVLAIWFMDEGSKLGQGVKITTNNFSLSEIEFLCNILFKKFNLIATVQKAGKDKGYTLYINKISMPNLSKFIKPYMIQSMYYKLGNYQ
jgi:ubiquinol-cytochrome c reductase cytochrome b subunit